MISKDDWRLMDQINYLKDKKLRYTKCCKSCENKTHEHCEFCFVKFDNKNPYGYCTLDNYYWICENCFNDFNKMFEWKC